MKLVRLVTENEGHFKSSFGNEMILKPNASIALLNLTFETAFEVIQIDSTNSVLGFTSDIKDASTEITAELTERSYTRNDVQEFYDDLLLTLNSCISDVADSNGPGSQLDLRQSNGFKQLEYRYSPFLNLFYLPGLDGKKESIFQYDDERVQVVVDLSPPRDTIVSKVQGVATNTGRSDNFITGNGRMCGGNGLLTIQVGTSLTNNGGAEVKNNGFGIGLTSTDLTTEIIVGEEIPAASIEYEIYYNRPLETYKFITEGGVFKDSGILPKLVNAGDASAHDVIYYKTLGGTLEGGVITYDESANYYDLADASPSANPWAGSPGPTTSTFSIDTNPLSTSVYKELDVTGGNTFFWVPQPNNNWLIFNTQPVQGTGEHLNLPLGNQWTQSGAGAVKLEFFTTLTGDYATYRRREVGTSTDNYWLQTGKTTWDIWFSQPVVAGTTPDTFATADLDTGILTIGLPAAGLTLNPSKNPGLTITGDNSATISPINGILTLAKTRAPAFPGVAFSLTPFSGTPASVDNGAKVNKFFEVAIDKPLYPYLYMNGLKADIQVMQFNMTIDPWINQGYGASEETPPYWAVTGLDYPGNPYNAYANGVTEALDNATMYSGIGLNAFPLPSPSNWQKTIDCRIDLSADIWNFLGYTPKLYDATGLESKDVPIGPNAFRECWSLWVPNTGPVVSLSDNFIVESLSIPLDSFDASRVFYNGSGNNELTRAEIEKSGRRKNILMTLPVNDNLNGQVQYEANNLIFIDINNSLPLNVRNLNFRVLTKEFIPINQSGESAVMTILIDG